jgi:hypothetical protein
LDLLFYVYNKLSPASKPVIAKKDSKKQKAVTDDDLTRRLMKSILGISIVTILTAVATYNASLPPAVVKVEVFLDKLPST